MSSGKRTMEKKMTLHGQEAGRTENALEGDKKMAHRGSRKRTFRTFVRFLFLGERVDFNPHPPPKSWRWWYPAIKPSAEDRGRNLD